MPIILTTAILVVPNYISNLGLLPKIDLPINFESFKFVYWIGYFALILVFSSFYSTIVLNPKDISDQLQKMAVTIPGIRPGIQTTFYLKQVMKRITLVRSNNACYFSNCTKFYRINFKYYKFKWIKYNFIINFSRCSFRFSS
jgi:preprotein translocase subunit SecY